MKKKSKIFNIVLSGVGGQGLITLGRIVTEAAFLEKRSVKMSELHGLSQRGGSVAVQIRIGSLNSLQRGEDIYSPLVPQGQADLVLALEKNEILRNCYFASKERTTFLINEFEIYSPSFGNKKSLSFQAVAKALKSFAKEVCFIEGSKMVKERLGTEMVAGVYILSGAAFLKLIPVEAENILKAIKLVIPGKIKPNKEAVDLAKKIFEIKKA